MSALDLRAFVDRSRALVDATPPSTRRETRAWLVDPFLETLGWDVHDDSCLTDATVDDTHLEYVLSVDGVPALFVAVEPFGDSLERERAIALLQSMAWTGIDRALYTDGRDYLFLAGPSDADRLACRLSSLPAHGSAVGRYSRDALARRLERHSREFVARQLAVERAALVDAIVAELTSATERGEAYEREFESAADRFLERLVATFADDGTDRSAADRATGSSADVSIQFSESSIAGDEVGAPTEQRSEPSAADSVRPTESDESGSDANDPSGSASDSSASEPERERDADGGSVAGETAAEPSEPASGDDSDATDEPASERDETVGDGEYVVRFFNDRGSIGAIGHSSSDQALVQTAEYLFERGLSGVTVPWSPDADESDERTVLNESPVAADGTPMAEPQQLSNGLYLETAGDLEERASRVEALVARAGLRAMLTGDWERE